MVYGIRFFEDMNKIEVFIAHTFHLVRVYNASVFDQMYRDIFVTAIPPFTITSQPANIDLELLPVA